MVLATFGQSKGKQMAENSQNLAPAIRQKRGVPIYMTNPSVPAKDEISRARRTQFGNEQRGMVIDGGTGEILGRGGAYMYEFEEVDKERFVKLFLDGIRKTAGLSARGLMIFELIYNQVRGNPNSDKIEMSFMVAQDRLPPHFFTLESEWLRHSREITLLCSPKVTHHHDQLGGVLPPGKSAVLPPGKSVVLPRGNCSVRACPCPPPQSNRLRRRTVSPATSARYAPLARMM
jgi:hypothetical protein